MTRMLLGSMMFLLTCCTYRSALEQLLPRGRRYCRTLVTACRPGSSRSAA